MGFFVVASMGSNRTFMELKYFYRLPFRIRGRVLIVPLWN